MLITLHKKGATGLKVWTAKATVDGVEIKHGSINKKPKTQLIPLVSCDSGDPVKEVTKRAEVLMNDGYYEFESDSTSIVSKSQSPKKTSSDKPSLDSIQANNWF